mmetsp:Transcript_6387/g.15907  ORF Transcript_6387/g.15907 Transcript_6387/m.15907 type:complete len:317 (+) Transcript_6387:189-1139(+)
MARADAPSDLPARGAERLACRGYRDGAVPHVRQGCKVHVPGGGRPNFLLRRRVDDVFVDLVRYDNALRSRLNDTLCDRFHFRAGEHLARRIVRRVEYDGTRLGGYFLLQLFRFQYPRPSRDHVILSVNVRDERQWHVHRRAPRELDLILVQIEERLEQNDLVPRLHERLQTQIKRLTRAHCHRHLVHRIHRPSQVRGVPPSELPHEVGMSRRPRVLMGRLRGVDGRRHERFHGEVGREPVGKSLAQVGDIVLLREASEFGPHRGPRHAAEALDGLARRIVRVGLRGRDAVAGRVDAESVVEAGSMVGGQQHVHVVA